MSWREKVKGLTVLAANRATGNFSLVVEGHKTQEKGNSPDLEAFG